MNIILKKYYLRMLKVLSKHGLKVIQLITLVYSNHEMACQLDIN